MYHVELSNFLNRLCINALDMVPSYLGYASPHMRKRIRKINFNL